MSKAPLVETKEVEVEVKDADDSKHVPGNGPPTKPSQVLLPRWAAVVLVLLSPLIFSLVFLWWFFGKAVTRPIWVTGLVATAVTLGVFLGMEKDGVGNHLKLHLGSDYEFDTSVGDVFLAFVAVTAIVVPTTILQDRRMLAKVNSRVTYDDVTPSALWGRQCSLISVVLGLGLWGLCIAKLVELDADKADAVSRYDPKILIGLVMTAAAVYAITVSRFWRPASLWQLDLSEGYLLRNVKARLVRNVVAGMGTIEAFHSTTTTTMATTTTTTSSSSSESKAEPGEAPRPPLVLVHGFAAGPGFFRDCLDTFVESGMYSRVLAVDWLGTGRSDRPRFPKHHPGERAEAFFVDGLEKWRQAQGLDKMVLLGHSLGGIIVSSYAAQYPQHIDHLILASPATPRPFPADMLATPAMRTVRFFWSRNVTPMRLVRFVGPFGPWLVSRAIHRRYGRLPPDRQAAMDLPALSALTYHSWALHGSGEFAMNGVLQPGADARIPLDSRLVPELCRGFPLSFVYGDQKKDWMLASRGQAIVDNLTAAGCDALLRTVPDAGHQVMVEQPEMFRKIVNQVVELRRRAKP